MQVDHINQLRHDNRVANLRLATHAENMHNRTAYANNASGVKGLHRWRGLWKGQVRVNGRVMTKVNVDRPVVEAWLEITRNTHHKEFAHNDTHTGGTARC